MNISYARYLLKQISRIDIVRCVFVNFQDLYACWLKLVAGVLDAAKKLSLEFMQLSQMVSALSIGQLE